MAQLDPQARAAGVEPARQASLRSLNLATVLRSICSSHQALSRADLAAVTGLTRSTVSRLVDELVGRQLVVELAPVGLRQRGRPATPLAAASGTWAGLGLEINVRHLAARLVDLAGNVLGRRYVEADFAGADPRGTIAAVAALGGELLAAAPEGMTLAGVRLALPGLVDAPARVLLRAPNLGWWDVRPAGWLADELGVASELVGIGNEADFAAVTVARTAPGRLSDEVEFLFVSGEVGVGSALVRAGDVVSGRHGWAGEIGHVCVDAAGPVCGCGARGCLERYLGLEALCAASGVADRDALASALASGDPRARGAVGDAARHFGVVLAGTLNLLDVPRVVLGGHLGDIGPYVAPVVMGELRQRVIFAPFAAPSVVSVSHDVDAPAHGAAYVGLFGVLADPASWVDAAAVAG